MKALTAPDRRNDATSIACSGRSSLGIDWINDRMNKTREGQSTRVQRTPAVRRHREYRQWTRIVLCLALTGKLATPCQAAEEAFFGELPVVLSASRLMQPQDEAPGATTVIDRAMIRASGVRDLAELLRLVPGFQVASRSGHAPLTTYHGLADDAPRRMLVRVDGRSAYSPYFVSGIEWGKISIDLEDIDRIEVFRGSNAAAYGTNAFLGVVNIITRPAADTPRARVISNIGDDGIRDTRAALRADLNSAALRLSAGRQQDDGQPGFADDRRVDRADLRLDWTNAVDQQLEIHAGMVNSGLQMGRGGDPSDPLRDRADDTAFGQIRWRLARSADEDLQVTYFHQEERSRDAYRVLLRNTLDPRLPPGVIDMLLASYGLTPDANVKVDFANRVIRDDIELEHTLRIHRDGRLVWGAGHREDRLWSPAVFNTNDEIVNRTSRVFGNLEWRPGQRWLFNFGATAEKPNTGKMHMAPRFSANYHMTSEQTLRFSASRAYRMPTPYETLGDLQFREAMSGRLIRYTLQPSPGLDPERLTATELGYLGRFLNKHLTIDARIFDERIDDLIERDQDAAAPKGGGSLLGGNVAPKYRNTGEARIRGAELSMVFRPALNRWIGLNYANLDINSNGITGTLTESLQIHQALATTTVPTESAGVFAHWTFGEGWSATLNHTFVGSMNWYATRTRLIVPAYHRTDIRLARRFSLGRTRAEAALTFQNTGSRNADFSPEQTVGRRSFVSMNLEF